MYFIEKSEVKYLSGLPFEESIEKISHLIKIGKAYNMTRNSSKTNFRLNLMTKMYESGNYEFVLLEM